MVAKLTRMTHKIAIQLYLVAESCTICISRSRRPVRKLLDTPSYTVQCVPKVPVLNETRMTAEHVDVSSFPLQTGFTLIDQNSERQSENFNGDSKFADQYSNQSPPDCKAEESTTTSGLNICSNSFLAYAVHPTSTTCYMPMTSQST